MNTISMTSLEEDFEAIKDRLDKVVNLNRRMFHSCLRYIVPISQFKPLSGDDVYNGPNIDDQFMSPNFIGIRLFQVLGNNVNHFLSWLQSKHSNNFVFVPTDAWNDDFLRIYRCVDSLIKSTRHRGPIHKYGEQYNDILSDQIYDNIYIIRLKEGCVFVNWYSEERLRDYLIDEMIPLWHEIGADDILRELLQFGDANYIQKRLDLMIIQQVMFS